MNMFRIIKEELGNIITAFITPLVALLLLGYVYSNVFVENIPYGIFDNDNSALSRNIISQLQNHPGLDVIYYAESESDLEEAINSKKINAGIVIPKDFSIDMAMKKSPNVMFLIDDTNMLIGGNALSYSGSVIGTLNAGVQMKMMQGNNMYDSVVKSTMGTFSYAERLVYEPQGGYTRNMLYTIAPVVMQMFFLTKFSLPLLKRKKKEFVIIKFKSKQFIMSVLDIIVRTLIISTVSVIASFTGLFIIRKLFDLPLRGDILIYAVLMYAFFFSLMAISFVFAAFIDNAAYFEQGYLMLNMIFVLLSGVAYPLYMIPENLVRWVKVFLPIIHVAIPLKALNLKAIGWDVVLPYLNSSFKYTVFWLIVGVSSYSISIAYKRYRALDESKEEVEDDALVSIN
ncbi:ABC transporter permease [Clostridium botulinum]|nr:ABC transporter permease [Clostridium botulinum]MBN1062106.1 ABC transporter permease [Clostridium botulinum]